MTVLAFVVATVFAATVGLYVFLASLVRRDAARHRATAPQRAATTIRTMTAAVARMTSAAEHDAKAMADLAARLRSKP